MLIIFKEPYPDKGTDGKLWKKINSTCYRSSKNIQIFVWKIK